MKILPGSSHTRILKQNPNRHIRSIPLKEMSSLLITRLLSLLRRLLNHTHSILENVTRPKIRITVRFRKE